MSEPLHVVAAVIEHEGRVLACRRRVGKADAGKWEFPGGKVEAGESAAEALVREIAEELGIPIDVGDELTTDDTEVGGRVIRLTCLRATLTAERPHASTDHDAMRWATPAELVTLDWAAPDLPAVRILAGAPAVGASATAEHTARAADPPGGS